MSGKKDSDQKAEPRKATGQVSFSKQVRPVLQDNCYGCHQPAKAQGGFEMISRRGCCAAARASRRRSFPASREESNLLDQITPKDGKAEMPRGRAPLAASDIDLVRRWIAEGAEDDSPVRSQPAIDARHPPVYSRGPGDYVAWIFRRTASCWRWPASTRRCFGRPTVRPASRGWWAFRSGSKPCGSRPTATSCWSSAAIPAAAARCQVWNVASRKLVGSNLIGFDTLYGGSWSPDGRLIAVGAADNALRAFDAENFRQVVYMAAHGDWIRGTVFSDDGKSILTASRDMTVKMTDVATQRFLGNVTTHTPGILRGGMQAIDRRPKRNEVVVGGADGAPKLFKMDVQAAPAAGGNPNQIREYEAMPGRIYDVRFSARRLAVLRGEQSRRPRPGPLLCY